MKAHGLDDCVEWVRRVNRRWIVRNGLAERAEEWLEYLARTDERRLLAACGAARGMTAARGAENDPKPWFYAGLFSPATKPEVERFLAGHALTAAAVAPEATALPAGMAEATARLVERLRRAVAVQNGR